MKRKGIITMLIGLCTSCFVSCTSDSEISTDKEILLETLTKGSWQVDFQHSLTEKTIEHADMLLTFTYPSKVNAHFRASRNAELSTHGGSYILFYEEEDTLNPDDELEYYIDRHRENDIFLSFAFGKNDILILNHRWEVKGFTSSSVELRANDITLFLNKTGSQ